MSEILLFEKLKNFRPRIYFVSFLPYDLVSLHITLQHLYKMDTTLLQLHEVTDSFDTISDRQPCRQNDRQTYEQKRRFDVGPSPTSGRR